MSNESTVPDQFAIIIQGPTWRAIVREGLNDLGGACRLRTLYTWIEPRYPARTHRAHWKAKVRQVVQLDPEIEHVAKGVWRLRSGRDPFATSDPAAPTS